MNNQAYPDEARTSIATVDYIRRGHRSIASDSLLEENTGKIETVNPNLHLTQMLPPYQNIDLSWINLDSPTFFSGITTVDSPIYLSEDSSEDESERGIFILKHEREILFTQEMVFKISELPERKHHIYFDPRDFDIDE